jgi:eukaryotic-like serine/threonine-protein kinase
MNSAAPTSSQRGPQPGHQLGRFQLLTAVGEGGMGRVWAARQVGSPLKRIVAVKTALVATNPSNEFQRLFLDEARIASLIQHPHVCGVHELGEDNGVLYLVMDWCDGATLRDVLDHTPEHRLGTAITARIVAGVAAGLHAAHELEDSDGTPLHVVHRDVSPQNVLISKDGHVKIADFGVAKSRGQLHRPTETGELKGKLAYMAPEQITAKTVDRRTDIFALGCILYEATTGQRPFGGEGALSTLYQILENPVTPPEEVLPGYPPALSAIVMRALAKSVTERYDTAEDFRIALETWLAENTTRSGEAAQAGRGIADLMQRSVGEMIAGKQERIASAIRRIENPQEFGFAPRSSPPKLAPTPAPVPTPASNDHTTVDHGMSRAIRERRSSWLRPAAGAAAVAASLVIARFWWPSAPQAAPGAAVATQPARQSAVQTLAAEQNPNAEPAPPTPPPAPRRVWLSITSPVPNAVARVDNGQPLALPWSVHLPADETQHQVVISAPGYRSLERSFTLERDQDLRLDLEPERKVAKPVATPRPPTPHAPSQAEPAQEVTPKPPSERNKTRQLDPDNPFASSP